MANTPLHRLRATALLTTLAFAAATLAGCFNTYRVSPEEFATLQTAEEIPVTVRTGAVSEACTGGASTDADPMTDAPAATDEQCGGGEQVLVDRDTSLYVRSTGGRRYQVTPFNFKMTGSQLVASDRDTLLSLGEIESYEVDVFNETNTILLISAGVAAVVGLVVVTAITAGSKTFNEN